MRYLTQKIAQQIDVDLLEKYRFTLPQLVEVAGMSVANALFKYFPVLSYPSILVCAGPGNNGADGLVAARNLKIFGYEVDVFCPKPTNTEFYMNLLKQLEFYNVNLYQGQLTFDSNIQENKYDVIIDSLIGFGFKPPLREPILQVIRTLVKNKTPICSVDVPSGWITDENDNEGTLDKDILIKPSMVISLTAPKVCMRNFKGLHLVGGRTFIPPDLYVQYNLERPMYENNDIIIDWK